MPAPQQTADEFGNKVATSEDTLPWQQAMLDEMRAIRLGIQMLLEYLHPYSGTSAPSAVSILVSGSGPLSMPEINLLEWAQSIRDGSEEGIT